jgi:hypothetical protein
LLNSAPQEAARSNQLRIVIAGADSSARTANPTAATSLVYTYAVGEDDEAELISGTTVITLSVGEGQTITFRGYDVADVAKEHAVGEKEVTVSVAANGAVTGGSELSGGTLTVVLEPAAGEGTLSFGGIDVTGADTGGVLITVFTDDGETEYTTLDSVDNWAEGVYIEDELPADVTIKSGRYVVEIELTAADGKVAFYREAAVVWAGLTTTLTWEPAYVSPPFDIATALGD